MHASDSVRIRKDQHASKLYIYMLYSVYIQMIDVYICIYMYRNILAASFIIICFAMLRLRVWTSVSLVKLLFHILEPWILIKKTISFYLFEYLIFILNKIISNFNKLYILNQNHFHFSFTFFSIIFFLF